MITDRIKELAVAKARVAELEQSVTAELTHELASLPSRFGFADTKAFIAAVKIASGKRRGRKAGASKVATAKSGKRRKRAKITDATRAEVKKLVEAGKTGPEIAKAVGISGPSVANIKKALGLVRKKK